MDHGAWPFSVDGATCLVNSVSMCEEKREERREDQGIKRKRKDIEMKRNERKDNSFSKKECFKTLKPAR